MKKESKYGTKIIGGKNIPLTKDGTPNSIYLTKEGKAVKKKYLEEKKKANKEVIAKELMEILKNL